MALLAGWLVRWLALSVSSVPVSAGSEDTKQGCRQQSRLCVVVVVVELGWARGRGCARAVGRGGQEKTGSGPPSAQS